MKMLQLSSQRLDLKNNSFDILRLILAFIVITGHNISLFKNQFPTWLETVAYADQDKLSMGSYAVFGFFVLSGILITRSAINSSSIWSYLKKRFWRIYPAYWMCTFLIAFLFSPILFILNGGTIAEFIKIYLSGSFKYFFFNITAYLAVLDINGLYEKILDWEGANGALWTLAYETRAYILIAVLMLFGVVKKLWVYIALFVVFTIAYIVAVYQPDLFLNGNINKLHNFSMISYFLLGSIILFFIDKIAIDWKLFCIACVGLLCSMYFSLVPILAPISTAYIVLFLGAKIPFKDFAKKYGDISYGAYLFGYPIQAFLITLGFTKFGFIVFQILSLVLATIIGYVSYNYFEKRFLSKVRKIA